MGNTHLDTLVEAGASASVADIDNIMALIRSHVHKNDNGNGNGNGNGSAPPAQSPVPAANSPSPAVLEEALTTLAQFNHELVAVLRMLGEGCVALQSALAHLQEEHRSSAEQVQTSLTSVQSHSAGVEQKALELERELAGLEQDLVRERESTRRRHFQDVRQAAQLEERIRQVNSILAATGRRLDGVANRAYNTEHRLDGVRERVEDALARVTELKTSVALVDGRSLDLAQRLDRVADELTQRWGGELLQRDESNREQLASFKTALDSLGAWFSQEIGAVRDRQQSELAAAREQISAHVQTSEAAVGRLNADLSDRIGALGQKLEALDAQGAILKDQYDHRFDELVMRLLRAERAVELRQSSSPASSAPPLPPSPAQSEAAANSHPDASPRNPDPPLDYFMFSLQHRGSVVSVRARQAAYAALFRGRKQVLDLGCGRGEFLELVSGNGTRALGVDSNRDMIDFARERGLEVVQADLFEYLQSAPAAGLDGIFSAQVIEHLAPDQIRSLLRLCGQKLGPDGLLVLETVNPLCPSALTNFWLDPTHVRPVLPKLLTFMLQEAGFNLKALRFNSPIEGSAAAPCVETANDWPAGLDQYQDYAAIAGKSK